EARLDAIGVFGYSDEEGTEAVQLAGKLDPDEIATRVERITKLADELVVQRAEDRIGTRVDILVEQIAHPDEPASGRAAHQGPDVDGITVLRDATSATPVGAIVAARVIDT